jgi:hypothetical protein
MEISTLGIDLSKTTFHVIGLNTGGEIVLRRKFSRKQLLQFTSNRQQMLIGMEACGGAHFLGRALRTQGHDAKLMPAQFVKPYRKSNKNDYLDAEAIAEAVERPTMRFVPIKTDDQLDLQALHRVRDRWVARRTAVMNQMRGLLLERGIPIRRGPSHPLRLNKEYSCQGEHGISKEACNAKSGRVAPMSGYFGGERSDPMELANSGKPSSARSRVSPLRQQPSKQLMHCASTQTNKPRLQKVDRRQSPS